MSNVGIDIQPPPPGWTTWHITWGTYGARLHGGDRPTVDREHNQVGEPFIRRDEDREERARRSLNGEIVILTIEQCRQIENAIPELCERGGWRLRTCAAAPPPPEGDDGDHVHVLLDVRSDIHGKRVREWLKRWVTQALDERWPRPQSGRWWAIGGSTKAVGNMSYLRNATGYVAKQRATKLT